MSKRYVIYAHASGTLEQVLRDSEEMRVRWEQADESDGAGG
jgi:hypothetical protein